jgi:hypothetical protein
MTRQVRPIIPGAAHNSFTGSCSLAVANARVGLGLRGTVDRWDASAKSPKTARCYRRAVAVKATTVLQCFGYLALSRHIVRRPRVQIGYLSFKRIIWSRATPAQFSNVTPVGQTPVFAQHRINRQRSDRWTANAAGDDARGRRGARPLQSRKCALDEVFDVLRPGFDKMKQETWGTVGGVFRLSLSAVKTELVESAEDGGRFSRR